MDAHLLQAFADELAKIAEHKNVVDMLARKASKVLEPGAKLPAISQVKNLMQQGNRSRAAEIASNAHSFLTKRVAA